MTTPSSKFRHVLVQGVLSAVLAIATGCASSGSDGDADSVDEADAFTPIRAKYATVTPSDLVGSDQITVAVVDADFTDGSAKLGFFPAAYHPHDGLCQMIGDMRECPSVAELVKAIDRRVDRMPFGILFTYRMRPASQQEVASSLPPAYAAFYREFQSAMKAEDIEFVTLMPENVVFLK